MIKVIITLISLVTSILLSAQTVISPIGKPIEEAKIKAWLLSKIEDNGTPGTQLAIINDGHLVSNIAVGMARPDTPVTPQTIFEGASLSKPLFAYFVMRLVAQELLDLDRPLYTYLPYKDIAYDERYKKITARYVLSHQTGFPNWRDEDGRNGLTIDFEPGTDFQYSGEGYQYLALVLQKILKTDAEGLQRRFDKEVAKPLGLKVTRYIQNGENRKRKAFHYKNSAWGDLRDFGKEEFGAAYGIHSNAQDWSQFIIALLNKEGLSKSGYQELFKMQRALPQDHPSRSSGVTDMTLGFYKGQFPFGNAYGHGGNNDKKFTSFFFFIPETRWGAVLFTNSSYGEEMGMEFFEFLMKQ